MEKTNDTKVLTRPVAPNTVHRIIQQRFTVEEKKEFFTAFDGGGSIFFVKDKAGEVVAITESETYANAMAHLPELFQFAGMLRDNLSGLTGEQGMVYEMVDSFLNNIK